MSTRKNSTTLLRVTDVVVILPAYNEAKYISKVLRKIAKIPLTYVVVDDGSHDGTYEIATKFAPYVLRHKINLGKGAAMKTGAQFAFSKLHAKAVIFMDSDDQHDPTELMNFYEALSHGHELIFGVRDFSHTMPIIKVCANRFASLIVFGLFGGYIPDIPSGYKAMTKKIYEQVTWQASNYRVELEIAVRASRAKIPFHQIPIKTIYHQHDKGTTLVDVFMMIFHVIVWRISV